MKMKYVIILLVAILAIVLISKSNSREKIVGIYHNDNWNGREATITINEDGTCKYPSSGDKCEWKIVEDDVIMTLFYENTKDGYIEVYLENYIEGYDNLYQIEHLSSIDSGDLKDKHILRLYVHEDEYIDEIEQKVSEYNGVKKTKSYKSETTIVTREHDAAIVDGGLILYDHFFKKMN